MTTIEQVLRSPAGRTAGAGPLDLHLCGARIGERELLERALLDFDTEIVVHSYGDLEELLNGLALAPERAALVVLDAENRLRDVLSELAGVRSAPGGSSLPVVVIGAGSQPEAVVGFYRAGASAVVHRSRFVDVWLKALREVVRFWAGASVRPSALAAEPSADS